jgi:formamidopyrimidine-DNA glycosylase
METAIKSNQEEMKAAVWTSQAKTEGIISSIRSRLEETMKNRMEDAMLSVYQRTKGLREECNGKIEESRLGLCAVTSSLIADTMIFTSVHEDLNLTVLDRS